VPDPFTPLHSPETPVVGLDPSLTSTGLAIVTPVLGRPPHVLVQTIKTVGKAQAPWYERGLRISHIADKVGIAVPDGAMVVMESPAYAAASTSGHDRSGLWWEMYGVLADKRCAIVTAAPQQRMMYATGKGRADKDTVLAATVRRYADIDVSGNDIADAVIFAAMGARLLGAPIDGSMPATHLRAMVRLEAEYTREMAA
jgi:crossover junction endodeoxyribonuclease RuvC